MRKKVYILIVILVSFIFTGCTSDYNTSRLNDNVLNMHYDINYINEKLNAKEKKLIQKFKEEQKKENLVIELNQYFDDFNKTTNSNSYGIWEENGRFYIKYKDINFIDLRNDTNNDTGFDNLAILYCNGYELYLTNEMFPILYYETKDSDKYYYSYNYQEDFADELDVHFISYFDNSGLTIRYIKDNNKITDIKLLYSSSATIKDANTSDKDNSLLFVSVITFAIGGIMILYYVIKKIRIAKKI